MKKLVVTLIAIVLVAAVVGSCFALYSVSATNKQVNINAGYQVVNMKINDATNASALANVDFDDKFDPVNNSQYVDVVLDITNASLADGVHGLFTVGITGTLADQVNVTVNLLTAVGGELSTNITADATGDGYDIALSSTPKAARITITLKDAAIADFSLAAEKTGTLTINWLKNTSTVYAYDDSAYYIVGIINGSEKKYYPNADSIKMTDSKEGNQAVKYNVTLKDGDELKVVKGYETSATWFSGKQDNVSVAGVSSIDGDGNVHIDADGTYDIYVNDTGELWVAVAGS